MTTFKDRQYCAKCYNEGYFTKVKLLHRELIHLHTVLKLRILGGLPTCPLHDFTM